jgi:hypothetical protein
MENCQAKGMKILPNRQEFAAPGRHGCMIGDADSKNTYHDTNGGTRACWFPPGAVVKGHQLAMGMHRLPQVLSLFLMMAPRINRTIMSFFWPNSLTEPS